MCVHETCAAAQNTEPVQRLKPGPQRCGAQIDYRWSCACRCIVHTQASAVSVVTSIAGSQLSLNGKNEHLSNMQQLSTDVAR